MSSIKVWPHMTIVAIICAVLAGLGVAFYMKHEPTVSAESLPNAARIQRVDGEVALNNGLYENGSDGQWLTATNNTPFSVGDRIYTRDNSHASLAFTGRNFARLNPNTSLDVIALEDRRTQLALRDGSAIFDVGYLEPNELFEVATPYGAVDFDQPGLYNVGLNNGNAVVSVLSGLAQVVGLGGSGQISKGEMLTLAGQTAAQVLLSRLDSNNAGYLVNDYYAYQYPNAYDGRYSSYDAYLADPYYYDPSRRYNSYQYVSNTIPGFYDLDSYGDWRNVDNYGYAWSPRVDSGWAPYQQGYWVNDYPYGMTWVSSEPWGYAPYHYGRWANLNGQWFWIPDTVNTTPSYAPALVAWMPVDANDIGWVPLGPGDPYAPRYYDANWQPYYLTRTNVVQTQLVNLNVPGAVAVVPLQDLGRSFDPRSIRHANPQMLAQVRPVLDPLTLTPLRNAVVHSAWGRGKIDLPPGIAKKLYETQVITSSVPNAPAFRKDLAKAMRVEAVPDKAKRAKFQIRDERGGTVGQATNPDVDQARKQKIDQLAPEAAKGNRDARRQLQELQQQQRQADVSRKQAERAAAQQQRQQQVDQQRAQRNAIQNAQGEAVGRREPATPRARQDVPRAREPQRRQDVPQPQVVQPSTPRARQDVPMKREPQGRVDTPKAQPQPQAAQPQPQAQRPAKPDKQQGPPAPAGNGQGQGGGKGKGKKP